MRRLMISAHEMDLPMAAPTPDKVTTRWGYEVKGEQCNHEKEKRRLAHPVKQATAYAPFQTVGT